MSGPRRSFLLLQGPAGGFFAGLGHALRQRGHEVGKVNFNGGDAAFWRAPGAHRFSGPPAAWPERLDDLLARTGATDVLLFGDCRPLHRSALPLLRRRGIPCHVFEEGYFRPDWVTCEAGGVNALSDLPRDPEFYLAEAARLSHRPWPTCRPIGPSLRGLVAATCRYYAAVAALKPLFPGARTHRPLHPAVEGAAWVRRAFGMPAKRREAAARQAWLLQEGAPFFLLALQLDADMQIRRHSSFRDVGAVVERVLHSFATHAPAHLRLVVKNHPLDCGHVDRERQVRQIAAATGLHGRVLFIDGGELPPLLDAARGVVVVNSTAGLSALHRGVPTIALGDALYDIAGLTHDAGGRTPARLDHFWHAPEPPDMAVYRAFRRVVIERTQINGGFYTAAGLERAVPLAADRIEWAGAKSGIEAVRSLEGRAVSAEVEPLSGLEGLRASREEPALSGTCRASLSA